MYIPLAGDMWQEAELAQRGLWIDGYRVFETWIVASTLAQNDITDRIYYF